MSHVCLSEEPFVTTNRPTVRFKITPNLDSSHNSSYCDVSTGNSSIPASDSDTGMSRSEVNVTEIMDEIENQTSTDQESAALDSEKEEVIMSVFWRKGMLGAAYYCMESSEISILNDIVDVNPDFHILTSLYRQVEPDKIVTSTTMSDKFVQALKSLLYNGSPEISPGHDLADQKKLVLLHGREYSYESCKSRILSLHLPGEPDYADEEEHIWYIHSLVNITAESMVLALGTLLKCLDKSFVYLNLEATQKVAPILAVNTVFMKDIVMIDTDTYEALKIFSQLSHPSNFKRGTAGSNKEGLSIFGIFNRCKSTLGCKFMRVMLLHPTRDIDILNARLDVVQFCFNPKNNEIVKMLLNCLKFIKSITRIVTRLVAARASVADWKSLHKTIYHSISLGELCALQASEAELFRKISECLTEVLYHVAHCINSIVDFVESEKENKFVVKLGIDEDLDRKKQKFGGLPTLMSALAQQELQQLPPSVKECSVIYIPEIGYLLSFPLLNEDSVGEETQLPGLELMFKMEQVNYYKTARCREMDMVLGDCLLQVSEHESRIMVKLVQFIQENLQPVHNIIQLSAELDCLISLATVARENNYVRPVLSSECILDIKDGRHPLQEMCVDDFVSNDTLSSDEHGLMKILTGPNASGKSVYLKQVALIAYLAHVGSFVPASRATVGILDHIHTRIQTTESIATRTSAFTSDIKQMSLSLYCSTPSSLIIVDEFGKGTSEVDGLALLAACLEHFLNRGPNCPLVFVSTHFHHVIELLPQSKYLKLQTMEHMADGDGRIVYLYKLQPGRALSSLTLNVAESLGVSKQVVQKSHEVLEAMRTGTTLTHSGNSRRARNMLLREEIATLFMSSDFNESDMKKLVKYLKKMKKDRS